MINNNSCDIQNNIETKSLEKKFVILRQNLILTLPSTTDHTYVWHYNAWIGNVIEKYLLRTNWPRFILKNENKWAITKLVS